MTLDYSDLAFAVGASALLAFGWTKAPPLEAPARLPQALMALSQLDGHVVEGDQCRVSGRLRNIGTAPLNDGELVLTFEEAIDRRASRVVRVASMQVDEMAPGSSRQFTFHYSCGDLLGAPRYRIVSGGLPLPVRGG